MVKRSMRSFLALLCTLILCIGCGTSSTGPEEVPGAQDPEVRRNMPENPLSHSTLADTAGMDKELRIIENKLGTLDPGIRDHLSVLEVTYFTFADSAMTKVDTDGLRSGVLVVHACIAQDVKALFEAFRRDTFPIAKVIPINRYGLNADSTGWNDAASMADNNTSAFNYRTKPTSGEHSKHAQGIAIDINPMQNPMVRHDPNGTIVEPASGRHDTKRPGTLTRANTLRYLHALGWSWGGRWPRPQDHQHIEKSRGRCSHLRFTLE